MDNRADANVYRKRQHHRVEQQAEASLFPAHLAGFVEADEAS